VKSLLAARLLNSDGLSWKSKVFHVKLSVEPSKFHFLRKFPHSGILKTKKNENFSYFPKK
jgi:hypothetical protein